MFLIDKYTPKNINEVFFHKNIYKLLKNMAKDESIPHIIFHGAEGTGKKTMIKIFLELLFDETVNDIYNAIYKVTGSSNKCNDEIIKKSDYHIIIEPSNTNYDRYLVHDVVKDYAKHTGFDAYKTKRQFKIIQINNLDNFPFYAQTSLRRTMENYSDKCRFIMSCNSLSNVIRPVQSRCICIRLPTPSEHKLLEYTCNIISKEQIKISLKDIYKIISTSNYCIKSVLWKLELYNQKISYNTDYDIYIEKIVNKILTGKFTEITEIRNIIFNISITNINHTKILQDIIIYILKYNISDIIKIKIMKIVSDLEYNLIRGRRSIIHFDTIIIGIINIVNENKKIVISCKNSATKNTSKLFC